MKVNALCFDKEAARARWVAMREARANGRTVRDIAAEYGISHSRVFQILKRTDWPYVEWTAPMTDEEYKDYLKNKMNTAMG
jgi:hypothetical protein